MAAGGRLTDWISLGCWPPRSPGMLSMRRSRRRAGAARRPGGKLPPHVMVYFAMALALFAEEVAARLTETLKSWGCWDDSQGAPTSGGITEARRWDCNSGTTFRRKRLGVDLGPPQMWMLAP